MRIVVDIKKGEPAQVILNNLYKHTQLQDTFGDHHARHRRPAAAGAEPARGLRATSSTSAARWCAGAPSSSCARPRRAPTSCEGYVIALDHLDEVIALIRAARTPQEARTGLIARFGLSEIQAKAILDLQLQRLTGLERQKIMDELPGDPASSSPTSRTSWPSPARDRRDRGRRARRRSGTTTATPAAPRSSTRWTRSPIEDMIADEDVAISITHTGYIKRTTDRPATAPSAAAAAAGWA